MKKSVRYNNYIVIENLKCNNEYFAIDLLLLIKVPANLFCLLKLYVLLYDFGNKLWSSLDGLLITDWKSWLVS